MISHTVADPKGIRDTSVGIVAVFDGHNGAEASEMASKLLLEYFTLHTYFLLDNAFSFLSKTSRGMLPNKGEHDHASRMLSWDEKLGEHVLHIGRSHSLSLLPSLLLSHIVYNVTS